MSNDPTDTPRDDTSTDERVDDPRADTTTIMIPVTLDEPRRLMYETVAAEVGEERTKEILGTNVRANVLALLPTLHDNREQFANDPGDSPPRVGRDTAPGLTSAGDTPGNPDTRGDRGRSEDNPGRGRDRERGGE